MAASLMKTTEEEEMLRNSRNKRHTVHISYDSEDQQKVKYKIKFLLIFLNELSIWFILMYKICEEDNSYFRSA